MPRRTEWLVLLFAGAASVALGCSSSLEHDDPGAQREAVVYGADGRTEVYAHANAELRAVAAGAVAMKIDTDYLNETSSSVTIDYTRTLGTAKSLCAGEAFAEQIEPGTCSGTLIDDRYLLTAGHCMDEPSDCTGNAWILGWRYTADGVLGPLVPNDVYRCARVIAFFDDDFVDHAVVELDRPVVGHTPATLRIEASGLSVGTPLALIGHPNGIPMKIDSGGGVTWNHSSGTRLRADLDAFNGNSGSGVFDHAGNLVALLRGGETDYVDSGGCNVVNVVDPVPPEDGEALVYLRPAIDALCATPGVDSPLCGCEGPCVAPPPGDLCSDARLVDAVDVTLSGTLVGYTPEARGSCGGLGPDRVYTFTLDRPTRVSAQTSGFDSVVYLRAGCDGTELACNDDIDPDTDRGSRIEELLPAGTYHLFVDAYDADVDAFTLRLTFTEPAADAGPPPTPDAGPPPVDAGSDAGPMEAPAEGCSCRAAGGARRTPAVSFVVIAALCALRRRRRAAGGRPPI